MSSICTRKLPCNTCGSSDALQEFQNDDGHFSYTCFVCNKTFHKKEKVEFVKKRYSMEPKLTKEDVQAFPYRVENNRLIVPEVNEYFGVKVSCNEKTGEVNTVYYPYYYGGVLSGYKIRVLPKDFNHTPIGAIKGCDMFGQHLCSADNKNLVITEGEEDCLAITQVLWTASKKKKFPNVVSPQTGASTNLDKDKVLKFINSHDKVLLCFDNDEAGRAAVAKLSLVVDTNKLHIMELSGKDASECLTTGKENEILQAYLNAKPYKPGGIVSITELWDKVANKVVAESVLYPPSWDKINKFTFGMRLGEIDTFTSGTGNGKTQVFREIIYHLLQKTNVNVGVISLEETLCDTIEGLMGIHLNKRIHLPDVRKTVPLEDIRSSFDFISKGDRLTLYDHFGSLEDVGVLSAIKYMSTLRQCNYIFLDHLSIVVSETSGAQSKHDRIERLMTQLKGLALSLNVWIGLIVHLRKADNRGTSFELGGIPTEDDLKDSAAIKQLSNGVYALQRNRRHSNETLRNVIGLHVLKQRFTGTCGEVDFLSFSPNTGRLTKIVKPQESLIENLKLKEFNPEIYKDF